MIGDGGGVELEGVGVMVLGLWNLYDFGDDVLSYVLFFFCLWILYFVVV